MKKWMNLPGNKGLKKTCCFTDRAQTDHDYLQVTRIRIILLAHISFTCARYLNPSISSILNW